MYVGMLYICIYVRMYRIFIYLSSVLYNHFYIHKPISTHQFIYPYTHTLPYTSICLSTLSIYLFSYLSIYLFSYPSIYIHTSLSPAHRVVDALPRGVGVRVRVAGDVASCDGLVDIEHEADHHLNHHRHEQVAVDAGAVVLQAPAGGTEEAGC